MAPTFNNIGLAEPSTITKVVASVVIARGSTNEHQEILVLGDAVSSLGVARVLAAAPNSTEFALAVRLAGGPSTAADCVIQTQGNSTVIQGTSPWVIGGNSSVRANLSSTAADNPVVVSGNSTVFQGGAPWTIGGNSSVRANLSSTAADNPVLMQGNSTVIQGTSPWIISGNSTVSMVKASTSARASISQSSTSVTLQSSNASRMGWSCFNNPTQNAHLYIKFGAATASTTDFDVRLEPLGYYEMPLPVTTELIVGVWDSTGAGFARVREVLP